MKTILITGAAQGLGRAIAQQLATQQNQLILLDKDKKSLEKFYDELVQKDCIPALYPMDLQGANPDDYQELAQIIEKNYGKLDTVFLNAASFPGFTRIDNFDISQWYEVLQANLNANFHLIQNTLPLLSASLNNSEQSQLVTILDNEIDKHPAYYGAYGVAKAGLEQLITTLSIENKDSNINFYTAKLDAFQSNTRSRHFPSEDPNKLPRPEATAKHLCDIIFNGLSSENIYQNPVET